MFNLNPIILELRLTDPVLGHQVANLIDQAHDYIKKDLRLAILRKLEQRQLYSLENGWINDAPDYIDAYLRIRLFPERRSVTAEVDGDQMEYCNPCKTNSFCRSISRWAKSSTPSSA